MANFAGAQIENTLAVKLESVAAIGIEMKSGEMHNSALFAVNPGAGAGAAAGAPIAGMGVSIAGAASSAIALLSGLYFTGKDSIATYDQYIQAAQQLHDAAGLAEGANLEGLAKRMHALENVAKSRASEIGATLGHNLVPGLGSLAVVAVELGGDDLLTGGDRMDKLKGEKPKSAGTGKPPPAKDNGDGNGNGGGT